MSAEVRSLRRWRGAIVTRYGERAGQDFDLALDALLQRLEKLEGAFREAQDEGQPECRNEAECGRLHDDIHRTWHRREAITQEEERK